MDCESGCYIPDGRFRNYSDFILFVNTERKQTFRIDLEEAEWKIMQMIERLIGIFVYIKKKKNTHTV